MKTLIRTFVLRIFQDPSEFDVIGDWGSNRRSVVGLAFNAHDSPAGFEG
ncbi:hypothetical protein [Vulgatibacter incomptus]